MLSEETTKKVFKIIELILDYTPGISTIKNSLELITGKTFLTDEDLSTTDKLLCAVSIIPACGSIKSIIKSKTATEKFEKIIKIGEKINDKTKYYQLFTVDDTY